jgi:hypothetical protein
MTAANLDEGIPTVESADKFNDFFRTIGTNLHAEAFRYSEIRSVPDFISENLEKNHDVWIEYHAQEIHKHDAKEGNYIHDGLIESFDRKAGKMIIIDSLRDHRQRIVVPLDEVERAISSMFGKETGFVVISKV